MIMTFHLTINRNQGYFKRSSNGRNATDNFPPSVVPHPFVSPRQQQQFPQPSAPPTATASTISTSSTPIVPIATPVTTTSPGALFSNDYTQHPTCEIAVATPVYYSSTSPATPTDYTSSGILHHNNTPQNHNQYESVNVPNQTSGGRRYGNGKEAGTYIGSQNDQGLRHGHGKMIYDDGSYYEGSWKKDKKHGTGILLYSSGPRLDGRWQNDEIHGPGTYWYPDGRIDLRNYRNGACVGEGVQFSSDRRDTFLLNGGRKKKLINASHANKIASRLGLSIPRTT